MKTLQSFAVVLLLLGTCVFIDVPGAFAKGEHYRRLAANLLVLQGDLRQLVEHSTSVKHLQSLHGRIEEKLAVLELLVRYANQENLLISKDSPEFFHKLKRLFVSENLFELENDLDRLSKKYPLLLSPVLHSGLTTEYFKQAEKIHQSLCSGCHSGALSESAVPAFDLFRHSRTMSRREFAARILTGLRGDQLTSLENPFTDTELSALISYYRNSVPVEIN